MIELGEQEKGRWKRGNSYSLAQFRGTQVGGGSESESGGRAKSKEEQREAERSKGKQRDASGASEAKGVLPPKGSSTGNGQFVKWTRSHLGSSIGPNASAHSND